MLARPIYVELALIENAEEQPSELERMQEREELRNARILTIARRRPFKEDRPRRY
jgi:hypothetical protein